jgi:hypothetical protein
MKMKLALNRCCCREGCIPYLPCCIRNLRISLIVEVESGGGNTFAYTKKFTLTNECNDQESVDWSTWEEVGNAAGGTTTIHGGRTNQGCTFGIDVSHEDLFCRCGTKNFTARLTLCNPHADMITITAAQPSMSVGFDDAVAETPCPLELLSADTFTPVELNLGEEHEFVMEFGVVDWNDCFPNCHRGQSGIYVENEDYLNDQFETTCLRPLSCNPGNLIDIGTTRQQPIVDDCIDALCPPCGCILGLGNDPSPPEFVSFSVASGDGDVEIVLPAGIADNDVLLLAISGEGEDSNADLAPTGWTSINAPADGTVASGTDGDPDRTRLTLYWARYDSDNPPGLTIPDAGTYTHAVITAWTNCRVAESPIHAVQSSVDATNNTSVSVTGLLTTEDDCMIVAITTAGDNITTSTWSNTHLVDIQQRVNEGTAVGSGGYIGIASGVDEALGTVPEFTATATEAEQEANWMVALRRREVTHTESESCECKCMDVEAKRACQWPKDLLSSATALGGEFSLCESFDSGIKALGYVAIFIGPNCEFYGGIYRNDGFSPQRWEYELMGVYDPPGPVGPLVQVREAQVESEVDCAQVDIEWEWTGTSLVLTVNGTSDTNTPSDWTPLGNGTVYLVAQTGSVWTRLS